jgi:anti-sigma factor RsiW
VTCREFVDFVMAYRDGELDAGERARFDAHLAVCPDCVRYLDQYRATVAAVQREGQEGEEGEALPDGVPDDLVQAIIAARKLTTN